MGAGEKSAGGGDGEKSHLWRGGGGGGRTRVTIVWTRILEGDPMKI